MLIKTDRLIIRNIETADGVIFSDMASDGSLRDVGFDAECHRWMDGWVAEARQLAEHDDPTVDYLAYTIELKETHEVIGSVGCSYYRDLEKVGITYFIGAKYRNHGYAVEAIEAYARYFFQHYAWDELIATIRKDNAPSWKAIEKAGFILTAQKPYQDTVYTSEEMTKFYTYKL